MHELLHELTPHDWDVLFDALDTAIASDDLAKYTVDEYRILKERLREVAEDTKREAELLTRTVNRVTALEKMTAELSWEGARIVRKLTAVQDLMTRVDRLEANQAALAGDRVREDRESGALQVSRKMSSLICKSCEQPLDYSYRITTEQCTNPECPSHKAQAQTISPTGLL